MPPRWGREGSRASSDAQWAEPKGASRRLTWLTPDPHRVVPLRRDEGFPGAQFLFEWTPNPGTAFYAGYNDDVNRDGFSPVSGLYEPGFRRNGRTFFVKMSYLFRQSF